MYDYYDNQEFDNFQKTQAEQEEFERYVSDEAQMRWEYEMDAYFNELYQKELKEKENAKNQKLTKETKIWLDQKEF